MIDSNGSFSELPQETLESWLSRLRYCDAIMGTITTGTEDSFLLIGERLRSFLNNAERISENSMKAAAIMSSEDIMQSIDSLGCILRSIETHLECIPQSYGAQLDNLEQILDMAANLLASLENTTDDTPTTEMTMINSANGGAGLLTGSDERNDEPSPASPDLFKHLNISRKMRRLHGTLEMTFSRISTFNIDEHANARDVLKETATSLTSLAERYGLSRSLVGEIRDRTDGVVTSINDVVISLQFDDITRQRLEHIRKVTGLMGEMLLVNADMRDVSFMSMELYEFCSLQIAHLKQAKNEFVAAVTAVIDNLRHISSNISEILKDTRKLVNSTVESSGTFLCCINQSMSSVAKSLTSISQNSEDHARLLSTLRSISNCASVYAKIANGQGARDNHMVAESLVRAVSEYSLGQVNVSDSQQVEPDSQKIMNSGEVIKYLHNLMSVLETINKDIRVLLLNVNNYAVCLLEDIKVTINRISIHKTVSNVVDEIISELECMAADSFEQIPNYIKQDKSGILDYTSNNFTGIDGLGPGKGVELF